MSRPETAISDTPSRPTRCSELKTKPAGPDDDVTKPPHVIQQPVSHEQTIGIEVDGKHINIPTVVDGQKVSNDEAYEAWKAGKNPETGAFGSATEADKAAKARSNATKARSNAPMFGAQEDAASLSRKKSEDFYAAERANEDHWATKGWLATNEDGFDIWKHEDGRVAPRVLVKGSDVHASLYGGDPEFAYAMSSIRMNFDGLRQSTNVEDRREKGISLLQEMKYATQSLASEVERGFWLTVEDVAGLFRDKPTIDVNEAIADIGKHQDKILK
jgi:hypothetical protein